MNLSPENKLPVSKICICVDMYLCGHVIVRTHTHVHICRHVCILAYGCPRPLSAVLLSTVPVTRGQPRLEADSPPSDGPSACQQ